MRDNILGIISASSIKFYIDIAVRLLAAGILGGVIGHERESVERPAGFRTHILVCVASALVMVTSEYAFKIYSPRFVIDPTRMGAQVISGIGFLGAGTIIREGFSVKGLTTAATLWAVSCIGIAVGMGFYEGAVFAALLIYLTLILLKKMEKNFSRRIKHKLIHVEASNTKGVIDSITEVIQKSNAAVRSIEFVKNENNENILLKILVGFSDDLVKLNILSNLQDIEDVRRVY